MGGETEKNIFCSITNREHLITERHCVGGPRFLELVSVLWSCLEQKELEKWWASCVHKDILLDYAGEVQISGPQGTLGHCFLGLLIQTKMYLQLEEEFSVECNTQTSRTRKSLNFPLQFLRFLTIVLQSLSFWKGNCVICRNLCISGFYQYAFGLFICLQLSLVRRSKPNPLECKHTGSPLFVLWNRLKRGCLWEYAISCLSLDFALNMRMRRMCCDRQTRMNLHAWQ